MSPFAGGAVGLLRPLASGEENWAGAWLAREHPWLGLGYSAEALAGYLRRPDPSLHRFLILAEGMPAGVFCLRSPWLRGPFVELLGLCPRQRGGGLGRRVIAWVWDIIPGRPRNLWATVSDFNQPARAFYARLGFREAAPLPGLVRVGHDEVLLRLTEK